MTTPSTERKAGPLLGTGAQTTWPFTFKVFAATDIAVTIADSLGVETALVYGVDFNVTLNANQETSPGGTVTYPISGTPLPTGSRLVIVGNLPYDQPLDLPSGGNFSPLALENELDRLTMQIQQLREKVGRAVQVRITADADVVLPPPEANELIGWDSTGQNLQNFALDELATALAYATMRYDTFTGDGVETQFTLTTDPVTLANLDVAISGVTQVPGSDYSLLNGVLVFTSAPANGTQILARYGEGLVNVGGDSSDIRFLPAGTGAQERTVQDKLRESVALNDFSGADPTGAISSSTAIANALAAADEVVFNGGTWLIDANLQLASGKRLIGKSGAVIKRNTDVRIIGISPSLTSLTATADVDYGSNLITLNAASYAAVSEGDYLYVKNKTATNSDYIQDFVATSTADLNDPSKWVYQVQVFKIIEKTTSNRVRVDSAAHVPFPLTSTGSIYKVAGSVIEDVVIDGLTFENGPGLSGASAEAAFINVNYVYGLTVKHCQFKLWGYTGGIYANFGKLNILNNEFDLPLQLAVFLRQNTPNSVVTGNTFRKQTSGDASIFVEAHNYNITIANNTFDGARSQELSNSAQLISAVQMDAKVSNCTITGNTVNGYGVGIRMELGCMFNTITANTIKNCDISGLRLVQSGQNVFSNNTFYNCGLATSPGTLLNAQGTIFTSSTNRNIFSGNHIAYDSGKGKTAFYLYGSDDVFVDNVVINATDSLVSGSGNRIAGNFFKSSLATSQVIKVSGTSAHYNIIEDNQLISDVACTYGIRIDDGAECNTVRRNVSSGCDYTVGLTSTSSAQSLSENTRLSTSNTATVNVYNTEISAPVMPSNATMPRRFRIYKTTTASGAGALAPQGASWWEFAQTVAGTNYFQRFDITTTQVGI